MNFNTPEMNTTINKQNKTHTQKTKQKPKQSNKKLQTTTNKPADLYLEVQKSPTASSWN